MLFNIYAYICIFILINISIVRSKEYSPNEDYLNIIQNIENSTKLQSCKNTIKRYSNCLIDYHDNDILPDYNKNCDIYTSSDCRILINCIQIKIKDCEEEYQIQLSKALTSANDISNLFCYRSKSDEFCPISKIFQKSMTVKEEVTGNKFYNSNLLQDYCLDDSCSQYIDESYIGIYALYNIGLISDESIMSSLKYIREYINSPDCNRIRKTYGKMERHDSSFSVKQYKLSLYLVIITIIVTFNFFF